MPMFQIATRIACWMATLAFWVRGGWRSRRYFAPGRCLGAGRGHGGLAEGAFQVGVAGPGAGALDLARRTRCCRSGARPGGQVAGGGEPGHVDADLGDDHVGGHGAMPGDRADQVPDPRKGSISFSIRAVSSSIAAVCWSIRSRCIRARNAWCSLNRPSSASVQRRDLGPQLPPGQLRQHVRVALPGDQRLEHGPPGDPEDVGGDRRTA